MTRVKQNFKVKLNSVEKIEELLQELYNEADRNQVAIQDQMNRLANSVQLTDESMEAKTKYAKAMNDFIVNKDKAIGRKMDIARLLTEVLKFNGNISRAAMSMSQEPNWDIMRNALYADDTDDTVVDDDTLEREEYKLTKR
ncbi:MAG: hypothetical protein LUD72_13710 [Bacteroidales bacterium]|nr:hypothetical protein [Bacteroidales bacterium]